MTATPHVLTTALLAERVDGELRGRDDVVITGVGTLGDAGPSDLTFITSPRRIREWAESSAAALLVTPALAASLPPRKSACLILVPDAELALIRVLELFSRPDPTLAPGIDPAAAVHPQATIGAGVSIGPYATVASGARIGDGVQLHAGVRIYGNVTIGTGSIIHANSVIRMGCTIGRDVLIHQNVSIGADGFGYKLAPDGDSLLKIPHIGTVIIENDVEIGAGTCIDRGKLGATVVGRGTKIDNLVQIAHNVRIGRCCVIAGVTGIAGSCVIGDGVQIAGQVGVADHRTIGSGAKIGGASIVLQDIPAGEVAIGYPAEPMYEKLRQWTAMRKLPALIKQLSPGRGAGRPPGGPPGGTAPDSKHASGS